METIEALELCLSFFPTSHSVLKSHAFGQSNTIHYNYNMYNI